MSYLDEVSGKFITGAEVRSGEVATFTPQRWGRESFKDGRKVVLFGVANGTGVERGIVINKGLKTSLEAEFGRDRAESAALNCTVKLGTRAVNRPDGTPGYGITFESFSKGAARRRQ